MFTPIENMTREEKENERDLLADFLAQHRRSTREEVLATLFGKRKTGAPFRVEVSRSQMQLRAKWANFEQGKLVGHICDEEAALKKGTCAYNRAASAYWAACCAITPGYEEVFAPGLFTRVRNSGWMTGQRYFQKKIIYPLGPPTLDATDSIEPIVVRPRNKKKRRTSIKKRTNSAALKWLYRLRANKRA